jgi:uncharacterized protein YecE (DUF72 family)
MSTLGDTGLHIGTSGWMYKDWGEEFYPKGMKKGHLQFLAQEFKTVEVNSSFYHLPLTKTFENWRSGTPDDFVFAVKLSRFITHQKKLKGVRLPLERFIDRAKHLEEKLGVVLVQLPPSLQFETKLLEKMIEDMRVVTKRADVSIRFALEPRHQSWIDAGSIVRTLLRPENVAIVFPHSRKIPSFAPEKNNVTADFVYVRFHGPSEFAASRYGPARLKPWAERIVEWRKRKIKVFVYFNNDIHGHAIHDARTLIRQIANRMKS